jgi:hypothetical protein
MKVAIQVRFTSEQDEMLAKLAEERGMTRPAFAEAIILKFMGQPNPCFPVFEITASRAGKLKKE